MRICGALSLAVAKLREVIADDPAGGQQVGYVHANWDHLGGTEDPANVVAQGQSLGRRPAAQLQDGGLGWCHSDSKARLVGEPSGTRIGQTPGLLP